jgi:hypothetical protein
MNPASATTPCLRCGHAMRAPTRPYQHWYCDCGAGHWVRKNLTLRLLKKEK